MISYNENEKRNIIMDYYSNPRYKKNEIPKNEKTLYIHSSSCVDEIYLNINDDLSNVEYSAQGCAIFISSVEIFIERLIEVKKEQLSNLISNFINLVEQKNRDCIDYSLLGKLIVFENVKKHLNRVECATLITKLFDKLK